MEVQPTCFVSGALAAALRVSKCAGAAPLHFVKQGNGWRVSLSNRCSILGKIFISFYSLFVSWVSIVAMELGPHAGRYAWRAVFFLAITLVCTVVYEAPRRMRCLISCLNQIEKIRSELKIQWLAPWTRKQRALFMFWAVVSITINIINSVLLIIQTKKAEVLNWLNTLSILKLAMDYVIWAGITQFVLVTMQVQSCFRAVNDFLRNLQSDIEQTEFVERSPYKAKNTFKRDDNNVNIFKSRKIDLDVWSWPPYEAIRVACSAYTRACDMVRSVDSVFGSMLILLLGLFWMLLISEPYNFIFAVTSNKLDFLSPAALIVYAPLQLSLCIYHLVILVIIIEPCHKTHVEKESTRVLVTRLMQFTRSVCDPLTAELEQFCMQLTLNEVSYRPLYATKMTRGMLLTILSSITTYLVVLIDMQ